MTHHRQHTTWQEQSTLAASQQVLEKVCFLDRSLVYEAGLWPDQCQAMIVRVRAIQAAASQLAAALNARPLPPTLVIIPLVRLENIERELADEAVLHLLAVKAVCQSTRVADLRLRKAAREHLRALLQTGQAVLDAVRPLVSMDKPTRQQQVHVWIVEAVLLPRREKHEAATARSRAAHQSGDAYPLDGGQPRQAGRA